VTVFVAVDHCTKECVGLHAAKKSTRFAALERLQQGVRDPQTAQSEVAEVAGFLGVTPSLINSPPPTAAAALLHCSHQIVRIVFDRRISRSAVSKDSPSTSAVAPIMRSAGSLG